MVEFGQPVLYSIDGNNDKDSLCLCVPQKNFGKGADLEGLSQSHGMGKDATKAIRNTILFQGLDDVVVEEPNPSYLVRFSRSRKLRR